MIIGNKLLKLLFIEFLMVGTHCLVAETPSTETTHGKDLWKKALSPVKVDVPITDLGVLPQEDFQGTTSYYPTETAIKNIVEKYWPELGSVNVNEVSGGASTGIIYAVARKLIPQKNVFFVKVSNKDAYSTAQNLKKVQESIVGRIMYKVKKQYANLPIVTNVERLFRYETPGGKSGTLEVTHAALGNPVNKILRDQVADMTDFFAIGLAVGKALGSFHLACMDLGWDPTKPASWRTIVHGDFHPANIFIKKFESQLLPEVFSKKRKKTTDGVESPELIKTEVLTGHHRKVQAFYRVYFIDNETMAESLDKKEPILRDVMYLIAYPTIAWGMPGTNSWPSYCLFFEGFLRGYVSVYPQDVQPALENYLQTELNNRIDIINKITEPQGVSAEKIYQNFYVYNQETKSILKLNQERIITGLNIVAERITLPINVSSNKNFYTSIPMLAEDEPQIVKPANSVTQEFSSGLEI